MNTDQTVLYSERITVNLGKLSSFMIKKYSDTALTLTMLYKLATTAGFALARVESIFSALSKIELPRRRSMSIKKEAELTFCTLRKNLNVTSDEFLATWKLKLRKPFL